MKALTRLHTLKLALRFLLERKQSRLDDVEKRFAQVKQMLSNAFAETAFYRQKLTRAGIHPNDVRSWRDFYQIPTTTKEELLSAGEDCLVKRRVHNPFISRSSGSSGRPLTIYQDAHFWISDSLIGIAEFKKRFDYRATDTSLYANTSSYPYSAIAGRFYQFKYFDNLLPTSTLYQALLEQRPSFFMAYPSIIAELMSYVRKHMGGRVGFHLKGVITHSEHSIQAFREEVGAFFGCPVYDEYATEELGRVALQCYRHAYHVIEAESYIEILSPTDDTHVDEGSTGEIVGTCMVNRVMPFIRYRQGDLASIEQSACPCGLPGRTIRNLHGRKNDAFHLPDGRVLSAGRLLDWSYLLLLKLQIDIRQFQLEQLAPDWVRLRIVPGAAYKRPGDDQRVAASFRETFATNIAFAVELVEQIPKTAAGKHMPIVRSFGKNAAARTPATTVGRG